MGLGEAIRPKPRSLEEIIEPKSVPTASEEEVSEWEEEDGIPLAELWAQWKAERVPSVVDELPVKLQLQCRPNHKNS